MVVDNISSPLISFAGSDVASPGSKKQRRGTRMRIHLKFDLTETEYKHLHREMKKKIPKPELCQVCLLNPPYDLACVDKYQPDPINFKWMCRSCHLSYDYENGTRPSLLGDGNPFFGRKHTLESIQKMRRPKHTEESKQRMREIHLGKRVSEETKQKMHERQLGKKNHFFNKRHFSVTRLRMVLANSNRKAAKLMSISGKFSIPIQDWMK